MFKICLKQNFCMIKIIETISGEVVKGRGLGKKLGFPTLNILYDGKMSGVFVGRIFIDGGWRKTAVHVGSKPTVGDRQNVCEAHIIDFKGENFDWEKELAQPRLAGFALCYWGGHPAKRGRLIVKVELFEKVRDTKKFDNLEDLKSQISKDVEFVKNWYNSHSV